MGRIAVGEKGREALDCDEVGRYWCGMCAFSEGNSACNSVKSRVVEYLRNSCQQSQTKRGRARRRGELTRNEVFRGSEAHIVSEYIGYQCITESSP